MSDREWKRRRRLFLGLKPHKHVDKCESCLIGVDDDLIVTQILSRLPAKSLMRFKCVCKAWKSTIEQDSSFIALHRTRSQTRPGLLVVYLHVNLKSKDVDRELGLVSLDLHSDGSGAIVRSVNRMLPLPKPLELCSILGPTVGGFICLANDYSVRICNVATRAVTPWMESSVSVARPDRRMRRGSFLPNCFFGFDPVTGNHKVMFWWPKFRDGSPPVCEILTLGESRWRVIDSRLPPHPEHCHIKVCDCGNGSVYWLMYKCLSPSGENSPETVYSESLVAFDFGSEQFRVIPVPEFTRCAGVYERKVINVDGCPTVMCRGESTLNMWTMSSEGDWSQVKIECPENVPLRLYNAYHSIPGKDMLIFEIHVRSPCQRGGLFMPMNARRSRFYCYDMKNKTFSEFKVEELGAVSKGRDCFTKCATLVESLAPV